MREGGREWGRERERERDTILEGGSCFFQDGSHVSESLSCLLLRISWRELHRLQRFHDCYCNYPETLVICESFILSGERYFNANVRHSSLQKIANFPKRVCLMVKICLSCLGKGHFQCLPRCPLFRGFTVYTTILFCLKRQWRGEKVVPRASRWSSLSPESWQWEETHQYRRQLRLLQKPRGRPKANLKSLFAVAEVTKPPNHHDFITLSWFCWMLNTI